MEDDRRLSSAVIRMTKGTKLSVPVHKILALSLTRGPVTPPDIQVAGGCPSTFFKSVGRTKAEDDKDKDIFLAISLSSVFPCEQESKEREPKIATKIFVKFWAFILSPFF